MKLPAETRSSGSVLETEQEIVQEIAGHLALWCESVENGYGHVSYREERVRDSAIVALRSALIEYELPLHAPEMPKERTVEDFVRGLTRRLETLPPGVVSLVWSDRLLSEIGNRYDLIKALNSSRERLKQPHLRQVWWMPVDFLEQFVLNALDLDSWFFCRLSLPDVPSSPQTRFEIESALPSVFMVPIKRNPNFTGRDDTLQQLETALNEGKNALVTQAISGLGGVGKTETVAEFAYRHANDYKFILWAQSDHPDTLDAEYRRIARELHLPESEAREADIVRKAVIHWLENEPNYLLILDNADNPAILPPFMPAKPAGHILLTSRSQRFPESIAIKTVRLGIFSQEQSAAFLLDSVYPSGASKDEAEAIQLLAKELGGLPLALELTSAYMRVRRLPPSEYLDDFRKRRDLTLQRLGPVRGDYRETVLTTWSRNFEEIQRVSPASAELLRICAFLSPDSIPFSIFEKGYSALPEDDDLRKAMERNRETGFEDLLSVSESYSLIEVDKTGQTFSIHRLVQDALRLELPEEARKEFVEKTISILVKAYPGLDFVHWEFLDSLLPHQRTALKYAEAVLLETENTSVLLNQTATHMYTQTKYKVAEPLYLRALEISEQTLGKDHPVTATYLNNLAMLYESQARYDDVEPLLLRALALREKQLGADHPLTGTSLNNLAGLYGRQCRFSEAEPLLHRALAIRENQLGADHPSTVSSLNNLAGLYNAQGRHEEAETLYLRALAIREKQLGTQHPDVGTSLNNLATLYYAQDRYEEAEPLLTRAVTIKEKQFGADHADTGTSLNNLASIYEIQGKYEEAELVFRRALSIREKQLGAEHPSTGTSLSNLAGLYYAQDRYSEAEPLIRKAADIYIKAFGLDHPTSATLMQNHITLLREMGRLEAELPSLPPEYMTVLKEVNFNGGASGELETN